MNRMLMYLGCMYAYNNNSLSEVWPPSNIFFRIFLNRSPILFLFTGLFIHWLILCNFKPSSSCILLDAAVVVYIVVVLVIILDWCSVFEYLYEYILLWFDMETLLLFKVLNSEVFFYCMFAWVLSLRLATGSGFVWIPIP